MGAFISILVQGVSYGLVLFLIATGMTLTMGLLRVVNMSHGALFLISGYTGCAVYQATRSYILAILAAGVLAGLLGLGMEMGFLRPMYGTPRNQVLLTIGFIYILTNVTLWIFGGAPASTPVPQFLSKTVKVGLVEIPYYRFFIILFGAVMAIGLWLMQDKTKIGARVRAGMDNGEISGTLGLNKKTLFTFIFVLGSVIAGVSSIIGGTLITLDQNTGWNVLLFSIIVVVVGGAGSIQGALIGGLLLGIVDAFGKAYFPALASYLFYIVLIIILVVRPQGLLGRKLDIDKASDDYSTNKAIGKRTFSPGMLSPEVAAKAKGKLGLYKFGPYALVLIVAIILPFLSSPSGQSILTQVLIYILFAMSLDIVMGYTGNQSFGHAAFFGMGGYTVGLLCKHFEITSFWIVLPLTIIVSAVLSAIIGYFTLKLSGTNFLLVTMAFGQLLMALANKMPKITGGADGITGISRPSFGFGPEAAEWWNKWWTTRSSLKFLGVNFRLYFFTLLIVVICFLLLHRFMRSSFGSTLKGIRGNEGRMRALGFNTWQARYTAAIIAGIFAGVAGMLYAYLFKTVVPNLFGLETSALPMLMIIMGGGGTLWGPAIGAAVIILVKQYSGYITTDRWPLILGVIFIICVMFLRGGFAPRLQRFWDWVGSKYFKKEVEESKEEAK